MNIQQFSKRTGLSAHTLRYYEKIGLLRDIGRNRSGHRWYSDRDLEWVEFIIRLKDMGAPLQDILLYADLRAQGDSTITQRKDILMRHAERVSERLLKEQEHLQKLQDKIAFYEQMIKDLT